MATTDPPPPRREQEATHRCLCRIVEGHGSEQVTDACMAGGVDPDSPLCPACIMAGHDRLPHLPYASVTPLPDRPLVVDNPVVNLGELLAEQMKSGLMMPMPNVSFTEAPPEVPGG